jgi:hypothetical protein
MQGAASVAPEPQSHALNFDPNGPGMGLDVDFNNFDLGDIDAINVGRDIADFGVFNNFGLDNYISNFSFEDTIKDAELSLGPCETQEPDTSSLRVSHLVVPPSYETDAALTRVTLTLPDASDFNLGTSAHHSNEMSDELRAQKRKKIDEVDKCHILPEGSRRNRNKTARARGLDSLA